jgi:hypothetical protein
MAKIVAVHGIGQQFKGEATIHREWWPALVDGLNRVKAKPDGPEDLDCAFYGNLFRKPGALAFTGSYTAQDVGPEEAELLDQLWAAAAEAEPQAVTAPASYGGSLARTPALVQRALSAISKSSFWADTSQSLLIGNLKQVVLYMNDPDIRANVQAAVSDRITDDTRVVIGHSLGSVVAYESLCNNPRNVVGFVTIGSPLGIQHIIFQKLRPSPSALGVGQWPGVKHWTNIADKGDIVALEKRLAPWFGTGVKDLLVNNGADAHHGERYLTSVEAGEAISASL